MANTAYRVAQPSDPDQVGKNLQDQPFASDAFSRMVEHLGANEVDLKKSGVAMSPQLEWNGQKQQFEGADDANPLLTRKGRPGFTVPQVV